MNPVDHENKEAPLFGLYAGATLRRCISVFEERGQQYSDTMRTCQFLLMKAVAKELGCQIPDEYFRVLCIAGFGDMKYQRLLGGYKEDSLDDLINYNGFVAEEMRRIKEALNKPEVILPLSDEECTMLLEGESPENCRLTKHSYFCKCMACEEWRDKLRKAMAFHSVAQGDK